MAKIRLITSKKDKLEMEVLQLADRHALTSMPRCLELDASVSSESTAQEQRMEEV